MKLSDFQIVSKPKIIDLSYKMNKSFEPNGKIPIEINNRVIITKIKNKYEAIVTLKLGIFTDNKSDNVPFKIKIDIEGHFKWNDVLENDKALLEILLHQNAPALIYSYARPTITRLTLEGNMPPLVLPMINFKET